MSAQIIGEYLVIFYFFLGLPVFAWLLIFYTLRFWQASKNTDSMSYSALRSRHPMIVILYVFFICAIVISLVVIKRLHDNFLFSVKQNILIKNVNKIRRHHKK